MSVRCRELADSDVLEGLQTIGRRQAREHALDDLADVFQALGIIPGGVVRSTTDAR